MSQTKPDSDGRAFAALAYIVPLLGGIIALIADRRNQLTRVHAQQSIAAVFTLVLSLIVWAVVGYIIGLVPLVGAGRHDFLVFAGDRGGRLLGRELAHQLPAGAARRGADDTPRQPPRHSHLRRYICETEMKTARCPRRLPES